MAGGWFKGLGQGLQEASKSVGLYHQLKQQALENALKERQFQDQDEERRLNEQYRQSVLGIQRSAEARQQDEGQFKDDMTLVENLPAGTKFDESQVNMLHPKVRAGFTRQAKNLDAKPLMGMMQQTLAPATLGDTMQGGMTEPDAGVQFGSLERFGPTESKGDLVKGMYDVLQTESSRDRKAATDAQIANQRLMIDANRYAATQGFNKERLAQDRNNDKMMFDARMAAVNATLAAAQARQEAGERGDRLQADIANARREAEILRTAATLLNTERNSMKYLEATGHLTLADKAKYDEDRLRDIEDQLSKNLPGMPRVQIPTVGGSARVPPIKITRGTPGAPTTEGEWKMVNGKLTKVS